MWGPGVGIVHLGLSGDGGRGWITPVGMVAPLTKLVNEDYTMERRDGVSSTPLFPDYLLGHLFGLSRAD